MDTTVPGVGEGHPQGDEGVDFRKALQFIKENFTAVSALALLTGVALSTFFLFSYLSVFDWHLIWFVQYVDVLSFGLVALGVLGSSLLILQPYFYMWVNAKRMEAPSRTRWIVGIGVVAVVLLAWDIWGSIHNNNGYFHIITGVLLCCGVVVLIYSVLVHIRERHWPNWLQAISLAFFILVVTFQSGRWLADMVLETNWFKENVTVKGQTLNDAKLIIVMSRFTVFLKDNVIHVFPTADITELQTNHKLSLVP